MSDETDENETDESKLEVLVVVMQVDDEVHTDDADSVGRLSRTFAVATEHGDRFCPCTRRLEDEDGSAVFGSILRKGLLYFLSDFSLQVKDLTDFLLRLIC